jgi:hypothetical protein
MWEPCQDERVKVGKVKDILFVRDLMAGADGCEIGQEYAMVCVRLELKKYFS